MLKISTNCLPCPRQKSLNSSILSYIFPQHRPSASRQAFGKDLLLLRGQLRVNKQRRLPRSKCFLFPSSRENILRCRRNICVSNYQMAWENPKLLLSHWTEKLKAGGGCLFFPLLLPLRSAPSWPEWTPHTVPWVECLFCTLLWSGFRTHVTERNCQAVSARRILHRYRLQVQLQLRDAHLRPGSREAACGVPLLVSATWTKLDPWSALRCLLNVCPPSTPCFGSILSQPRKQLSCFCSESEYQFANIKFNMLMGLQETTRIYIPV